MTFCDLLTVPAGPVGRFLVTQMAAVAELYAGLVAQRTRAALAAAKTRGVKLGGWRGGPKVDTAVGTMARHQQADAFAASLAGIVTPLRADGASLRQIGANLTARGIKTARGRRTLSGQSWPGCLPDGTSPRRDVGAIWGAISGEACAGLPDALGDASALARLSPGAATSSPATPQARAVLSVDAPDAAPKGSHGPS